MTHADLIDKWLTLSDFADDIGVAYGTAKAMRRRNSIPSEYWLAAVQGAESRGFDCVTLKALAAAVAKQPEVAQ
ncbi:hypothetical protein [Rhizobium sp. CSW-27]|uniref:hypothetical protein n=1 Tax=Rhizobium sp. CSW-27 TaxID=2839985 RepID=UPI001C0192CF|nr:hypothetical protein [Rhizobium sp. CSW-27]MBT9370300.1 hypothetical protein [Rhizobium sp. CSW-27]